VQVNSLGLTEQQPENNVYRILIEMLAVTLSKKARARAVQLPAWNEALGLPRPWDQQWSMRMQQILAYETDLLEFDDLFDGNPAVDAKVEKLKEGARAELANLDSMGGAIGSIEYMKGRLVDSNADRLNKIERNETIVVGVNKWVEGEPSPLQTEDGGIMVVDPAVSTRGAPSVTAMRYKRRWPICVPRPRKVQTLCPPLSSVPKPVSQQANGLARCAPSTVNTVVRPVSPNPCPTRPKALMTSAMP
jgi:(2R)-ethylmalonyl-CoA mutase